MLLLAGCCLLAAACWLLLFGESKGGLAIFEQQGGGKGEARATRRPEKDTKVKKVGGDRHTHIGPESHHGASEQPFHAQREQ